MDILRKGKRKEGCLFLFTDSVWIAKIEKKKKHYDLYAHYPLNQVTVVDVSRSAKSMYSLLYDGWI